MSELAAKLLELLDAERPAETRRAAVLVVGEVGLRDAATAKAICASLEDADPAVRLEAIRAAGKLKVDAALPLLLERIKVGGVEAEQAALSAARLGARGTRALQELMPKVAPGLRRYIASALAAGGTASAETAAVAVLLDSDPGVVEAAVRSLIGQVPTLTAAHRRAWADHLLELLADRKRRLSAVSEAAVVRLLVALGDPRAEKVLWDRVLPPHPPEVRSAALQALGKWVAEPGKDQLKRLFACAADPDFRVAAPALVILKSQAVTPRTQADWLGLLQAPDVAVRHVAIAKLADRDMADVAAALVEQLGHPDRALREDALARLAKLKHGRAALTGALLEADTPDRAWSLARAQAPFAKDYDADWKKKVFDRAARLLEADDRRADALLFLLREADAAGLRDRLEERAAALRKKKDYEKALLYLRLLTRDPACSLATRLEHAACLLKTSSHDLAADARAADPALQQFAHLIQQDDGELLARLDKLKWLDPEDLYYVGFHFAEQEGRAKKFAGEVLRRVVKAGGRSKVATAARSKLRGAGLE
jgi:HEAT repeat protein